MQRHKFLGEAAEAPEIKSLTSSRIRLYTIYLVLCLRLYSPLFIKSLYIQILPTPFGRAVGFRELDCLFTPIILPRNLVTT